MGRIQTVFRPFLGLLLSLFLLSAAAVGAPKEPADCQALSAHFSGGSVRLRRLMDRQARLAQYFSLSGVYKDIYWDIVRLKDGQGKRNLAADGEVTVAMGYETKGGHLTIEVGSIKKFGVDFGNNAGDSDRTFTRFLATILEAISERRARDPESVKAITIRAVDVMNPGLQGTLPELGFEKLPSDPNEPPLRHPVTGQPVPAFDYELKFVETN